MRLCDKPTADPHPWDHDLADALKLKIHGDDSKAWETLDHMITTHHPEIFTVFVYLADIIASVTHADRTFDPATGTIAVPVIGVCDQDGQEIPESDPEPNSNWFIRFVAARINDNAQLAIDLFNVYISEPRRRIFLFSAAFEVTALTIEKTNARETR